MQSSQTAIHRVEVTHELPRESGYKETNSYTRPPAFEQIMTIILFVVIAALHSVFITTGAAQLSSPIFWTVVGVTYGLAILIGYDYVWLTCNDPVDDLVLKV